MNARVTPRPVREEQAQAEVGHTDFAPGVQLTLIVVFIAFILIVPALQYWQGGMHADGQGSELRIIGTPITATVTAVSAPPNRDGVYKDFLMQLHLTDIDGLDLAELRVSVLAMQSRDILPIAAIQPGASIHVTVRPWAEATSTHASTNSSVLEAKHLLTMPAYFGAQPSYRNRFQGKSLLALNAEIQKRIGLYEQKIDDESLFATRLRAPVQRVLAGLGAGNEKAYVGRDGWLFYGPDVRALTGPAFGHAPRDAIIHFRDQLAVRGIELILLPTPVKPSIHPDQLAGGTKIAPLRNRGFQVLIADLAAAGIQVYDPAGLLKARASSDAQYLATDTHWTPQAMHAVAEGLGDLLGTASSVDFITREETVTQPGDIAIMLGLSDCSESAHIRSVVDWRSDPESDVLLLGDSFSNIYSMAEMGWGKAAGLAEHISLACGRRIDRLTRNDDGAYASRQLLADALHGNPHRLASTKVVIWQFAERELVFGDWKHIDLPPAPPPQPLIAAITPTTAKDAFARLAATGDAPVIVGQDKWLFLRSELRFLAHDPFWGESAESEDVDPLQAIIDLNAKLLALGIDLIFAPAPPRAVIYPDKLFSETVATEAGAPVRLDTTLQEFYAALRKSRVKVLDVTDAFLAARKEDASLGTVSCERDSHWAPRGLQLAANAIVAEFASEEWATSTANFASVSELLTYTGDLVQRVPDFPFPESQAQILKISPEPFADDSPVLLLADSHGLIFSDGEDMHCRNAGFGEHIAATLGMPIDLMARRGSGAQIRFDLARRFLTNPKEARGKRVLIYTFAARTLTESKQWKSVPLAR